MAKVVHWQDSRLKVVITNCPEFNSQYCFFAFSLFSLCINGYFVFFPLYFVFFPLRMITCGLIITSRMITCGLIITSTVHMKFNHVKMK